MALQSFVCSFHELLVVLLLLLLLLVVEVLHGLDLQLTRGCRMSVTEPWYLARRVWRRKGGVSTFVGCGC